MELCVICNMYFMNGFHRAFNLLLKWSSIIHAFVFMFIAAISNFHGPNLPAQIIGRSQFIKRSRSSLVIFCDSIVYHVLYLRIIE